MGVDHSRLFGRRRGRDRTAVFAHVLRKQAHARRGRHKAEFCARAFAYADERVQRRFLRAYHLHAVCGRMPFVKEIETQRLFATWPVFIRGHAYSVFSVMKYRK